MSPRLRCGAVALLASLALVPAAGAQTASLAGVVQSAGGVPVPSASVLLRVAGTDAPVRSSESDSVGHYHIAGLAQGRYEVTVTRLGFASRAVRVTLRPGEAATVDVLLRVQPVRLPGVVVEGARDRARFEAEAGTTVRELARDEIKLIPGLAEPDVLRAVEALPGVVTTTDLSSAFNVRGGAADQNLILLDGVPIYNPFHLGGLFSTFNADMIGRAELHLGGFPAEHGGRVSSVLNLESDASGAGWDTRAGLSLLATRVAAGGDLPRLPGEHTRRGRWRLSGRRSYFDQVLRPFFDFPYHLADVQGYAETWTNGGGRISASGYTGEDVLDLTRLDADEFPLRLRWEWGNDLAGVRWTAPRGPGRVLDARAGYTRFGMSLRFPDFDDTRLRSEIGQFLARVDLGFLASYALELRTGAALDWIEYDNLFQTGGTVFEQRRESGLLTGAYLQGSWRPDARWLIEAGARAEGWFPSTASETVVLSPRVAVKRFFRGGDAAVKLAAGRYTQFVHSTRDEELPLGIDVWVIAGARAPHVTSDQVQVGLEKFFGDGWSASLEAYHRSFDGVIAFNFGEDPNDPADDLVAGTGTSYGADLLVRRDGPGVSGWVAASWLRASRTFPDAVSGLLPPPEVRYAPVFDRRLDLELVLRFPLFWRLDGGLNWSFGSGIPYTRPLGSYVFYEHRVVNGGRLEPHTGFGHGDEPAQAVVLGPRNGERYPPYHRLDLSLRRPFPRSWGRITPHLEILNVYNRKNTLFYFYQYDRDPPVRSGFSMLPLVPTLGVEVQF